MPRVRKILFIALTAGIIGWCWRNRGWFLGLWVMRHAND